MNRSFTARLSAKTPRRLRDYLWATHRVFNESLAYLLKHYFWLQNLTDRDADNDKKNVLRRRFDPAQIERLRLIYRDMMGLDLPKEKRAGRSQSAQAWMEPITYSSGSRGEGPGESSKNIDVKAKKAIREIRAENLWLFDRELAFPVDPNNGFRRGLFGVAARRILNFEQNKDTHQGYYAEAQKAFERWTGGQHRADAEDEHADGRRAGWKGKVLLRDWGKNQNAQREDEIGEVGRLTWADFERAKSEFEAYQRSRAEDCAGQHSRPLSETDVEVIGGAMARGWRDIYERLMPPNAKAPPDAKRAERIIKDYQRAEPRKIGDINFFLWLADKCHLWRFVDVMRAYNGFQRRLAQYARPIQFRYPRYSRRPEWFSFSETSPGHMYAIVSMCPMVVEMSVFVPAEDAPILKKLVKGAPLTEDEMARLDSPIDWNAYILTAEKLDARRAAYRTELEKRKPGLIKSANLDAVHKWTDGAWKQLLEGFFRDEPPLDMSRFELVMVRYTLATDSRLGAYVESPKTSDDLLGRLVVLSDERQKPRWQGDYRFWFGPLAPTNGEIVGRRKYLRSMPLVFGGIRLEYRGRLREDSEPIFTLSCDLDERVADDGKMTLPAPKHRIPKREPGTAESLISAPVGKKKRVVTNRKQRKMPVGAKLLFIDLGMRHIATGAVVEFVDAGSGNGVLPNPFRPLAVEFLNVPGVALSHIQRHQDERRRKQRAACPRGTRKAFEVRGAHLPRGQGFARELLDHAENLKDDRRKKAANAILLAALKHQVDYIAFENLTGYRPEMEFGRRCNAALMNWNRRELVEFVKMEAAPFGIWVCDWIPPHHTSRFCHRCGAVGSRFSHVRAVDAYKDAPGPMEPVHDEDGNPLLDTKGDQVFRRRWTPTARRVRGTPLGLRAGMRQVIDGGKQFCCSECKLIVNADYNAAMNLARKLADDFQAYQQYNYNNQNKTWVVAQKPYPAKAFWGRAKAIVQTWLNRRFKQPSDTPPAGGWPEGVLSHFE